MTTATTAATRPATTNTTGSGHPGVRWAATRAPTATRANWPSESCPAHPVSTVSDSATTAKRNMRLAKKARL